MAALAPAPAPAPALPPPPTNYIQINAIRRQIADLNSKSSESHMYGIWDAILNWQFPVTDEYITIPQALHKQFRGQKGFSDFHTLRYDAAGQKRYFLITQCKPPYGETQPGVWDEARDQLIYYFNLQHKTQPARSVYGIAAVGRRVRFYKYNFTTRSVVAWRPGENGLPPLPRTGDERRNFYLLRDEADKVQKALDWIRDHP